MTTHVKQNLLQHKESAAETIMKNMEKPAQLLAFLTEAISWVSEYDSLDNEKKKSAVSFLTTWINYVVDPWAFDQKYTPKQSLCFGMDSIFDYNDYEEYEKTLSNIIGAFGFNLSHSTPNIILYQQYMYGISMLAEVSFCLFYFEKGRNEAA
jgi:hypothetical protein